MKQAWKYFTKVAGAIGLINLFKDIWQWIEVFSTMGSYYWVVAEGLWGWFPFVPPDWFKHYYFYGILFLSSSYKGKMFLIIPEGEIEYLLNQIRIFLNFVFGIIQTILFSTFWPLLLLITTFSAIKNRQEQQDEINAAVRSTLLWFLASIGLFLLIALLNYTILQFA